MATSEAIAKRNSKVLLEEGTWGREESHPLGNTETTVFNGNSGQTTEEEKLVLKSINEILTEKYSSIRVEEILRIEKSAEKRNYNIPKCSDCGKIFNGKKFVELGDGERACLVKRPVFFSNTYCRPCIKKIRKNLRLR